MLELKFTIYGNQENPDGNPIPFKRILNTQWRPDSTRYVAWQRYVRKCFYDGVKIMGTSIVIDDSYIANPSAPHTLKAANITEFPINVKRALTSAKIEMAVYSADGTIGDLDNILKGVLDSLFKDDNCVTEFHCKLERSPDRKGRIETVITLETRET